MSPDSKHALRWGIAIVTLSVGIITSLITWQSIADTRQKVETHEGYLERVNTMKGPVIETQSTFDLIALLNNASLAKPDQLVNLAGISDKASVKLLETNPLKPGWERRLIEINLTDIPGTSLSRLLKQAESQRPPWRLTNCSLAGSAISGSFVTARLTFEGIQPASR